jgi:hypothetical protein
MVIAFIAYAIINSPLYKYNYESNLERKHQLWAGKYSYKIIQRHQPAQH